MACCSHHPPPSSDDEDLLSGDKENHHEILEESDGDFDETYDIEEAGIVLVEQDGGHRRYI